MTIDEFLQSLQLKWRAEFTLALAVGCNLCGKRFLSGDTIINQPTCPSRNSDGAYTFTCYPCVEEEIRRSKNDSFSIKLRDAINKAMEPKP